MASRPEKEETRPTPEQVGEVVTRLHVNRPYVADSAAFLELAAAALERGWLTNNGPLVIEFEQRLADYLDVEHCVAMANGSVAMALTLRALNVSGQVLLPAFTFVSTANSLVMAGLEPVFCDIDEVDWCLSATDCQERATPSTGAVIPTHLWGRACEVEALEALADERGVPLVFDAAHAFGCSTSGRRVGGFGTAEVFSLHATKILHSCEGGFVTTGDGRLADRLRGLRNFGFRDYDEVDDVGTNAKMSEIHAAMGLANLEAFPETLERCLSVHDLYREQLSDIDGLRMRFRANDRGNGNYVVVEVLSTARRSRDELIEALHAEGILARRYFYPGTHRLPTFSGAGREAPFLPVTEAVSARVLVLPGGASLSEKDVMRVTGSLRTLLGSTA